MNSLESISSGNADDQGPIRCVSSYRGRFFQLFHPVEPAEGDKNEERVSFLNWFCLLDLQFQFKILDSLLGATLFYEVSSEPSNYRPNFCVRGLLFHALVWIKFTQLTLLNLLIFLFELFLTTGRVEIFRQRSSGGSAVTDINAIGCCCLDLGVLRRLEDRSLSTASELFSPRRELMMKSWGLDGVLTFWTLESRQKQTWWNTRTKMSIVREA